MAQLSRPANDRGSYRDSVARLAVIRKSLARAEATGAGPAPDLDARSDQVVGASVAGLNALAAVQGNSEASRELVERIRRELAEISNLVLR
jgi:hypothetical protein